MAGLWQRVETEGAESRLKASGVTVGAVVGALEADRSPAQVIAEHSLAPADLVAALGVAGLGPEGTAGPPLIQARPSRPRLEPALDESAWSQLLPGSPRPARLALLAGLLQIHDFWDPSHTAAQQADDLGERGFSAYWHGIAHRREPDSGNASYWFRRVGRHPLFAPLGASALELLRAEGEEGLAPKLVPAGIWNPSAFISLCADGRPAANVASVAQKLQRLEMALLLEATSHALGLA
jgi:hypothetical protein